MQLNQATPGGIQRQAYQLLVVQIPGGGYSTNIWV